MIFQLATYEPHAFLIVLAVDDLSSLDTVSGGKIVLDQLNSDQADYLLGRLESSGSLGGRAAILVANKTDLVRWISFNCNFTTSVLSNCPVSIFCGVKLSKKFFLLLASCTSLL